MFFSCVCDMHRHMRMRVCVHASVHAGGRLPLRVFLSHSFIHGGCVSHLKPELTWARLPPSNPCLCLSECWNYRGLTASRPPFSWVPGNLHFGPHTCTASTFPTEQSPSPITYFKVSETGFKTRGTFLNL